MPPSQDTSITVSPPDSEIRADIQALDLRELQGERPRGEEEMTAPKGLRFWLIFVSVMTATFCATLDMTAVSTSLPTIVHDLHGHEFTWVGSSYNLASTAFMPLSGGLAQIFGRKVVLLGALVLFIVGSGVCGGATTFNMLIVGRTIQGVGCGGILTMKEIIIADLIPLKERGTYMGIIALVWALSATGGPPIGGVFAKYNWRWMFYVNVPLAGIALILVALFLHVKTPKSDFATKMKRMDWLGNFLVIAATSSFIIGLTWGGVEYAWSSWRVIVPLVLGAVGLIVFVVYEARVPLDPILPWELLDNRTSLTGYVMAFLHGLAVSALLFYGPVYYQGARGQSPIKAGLSMLGVTAFVAPGALVCGLSITKLKVYWIQNALGWACFTLGIGLLSMIDATTSEARSLGYGVFVGIGIGMIYVAPMFPVLAALPVTEAAHALALFMFIRNFSFTWGVTIGSTILQNKLKSLLPPTLFTQSSFTTSESAGGIEIAYAIIPVIPSLPKPLMMEVRTAFGKSLQLIWHVLIGVIALGLLSVVALRELPMHDRTADEYQMKQEEERGARDGEKGVYADIGEKVMPMRSSQRTDLTA